MAVALMKAVSDLWLMYVLKVTPTTIAPMPVVGGGAGGGGGGYLNGPVYGPGAGSAGEVIVLAMNYAPLTVNAAGGSAGCTNTSQGAGGGAGGYVVVLVPDGETVSVSANVSRGAPCTANGLGCGITAQPGQNGVLLTPTVTIGVPSKEYPLFALGVSFTYAVVSPVSASWANALGVSFTYTGVSSRSISWTNTLSVSYSHSP
jgi:hypothetical protein